LKAVYRSRVTWATYEPISVFLGLSVLELGPMYATDRQTDRCQTKASLNDSAQWGWWHNKIIIGITIMPERNGGTHCDWPVDGIGHW